MAGPQTNDARSGDSPGLAQTLLSLVGAGAGYLRARLQLLGLESREAAIHLAIIAGLVAAAAVLLLFTWVLLVLSGAFLVQWASGLSWAWVALVFGVVHLIIATVCLVVARARLREPVFTDTLNELRKDREWLETANPPTAYERS